MLKPLPRWVLTNDYPAFYDTESVTAIEMVAKLYGRMQELIEDYNHFIDNIEEIDREFEEGLIEDFNDFKDQIQNELDGYIALVNQKLEDQDEEIADAILYMKTNLIQTAESLFAEYLSEGKIYVSLAEDYDEPTESLTLGISAIPSEELLADLQTLATVEEGE